MLALMDDNQRWERVLARDKKSDGLFVTAVKTTGIYCRPSCPARHPYRKNVDFYVAAESAALAGFRACLRCKPELADLQDPDLVMIKRACQELHSFDEALPKLEDLATACDVSPHHLQRRFKAIMGISPKDYGDELRRKRFRDSVKSGEGVSDALYGAGYGSSSRLYETADRWLGMSPSSYAKGGKGAQLYYAISDTPLGRMIVAATQKGIAFLGFGDDDVDLISELDHDFPLASKTLDNEFLGPWLEQIISNFDALGPKSELPLDMLGTAFQRQVWQALCDIPPGETKTYKDIAVSLGKPKAARAVGRACATNPVSLIVPCHRAIGTSGSLTGYRWGIERKKKLLSRESST